MAGQHAAEDLLTAIPRMYRQIAERMLRGVPIVLTATVGKLTDRQRIALADALDVRDANLEATQ